MSDVTDLQEIHGHASGHRAEILTSQVCGCFYCRALFEPSAIVEWVDEVDGVGTTALCPECGVDSVIGSASGFAPTDGLLVAMHARWFG